MGVTCMEFVFRFIVYVLVGIAIEVSFVAISKIVDGKIRGRDVYLEGKTYLWMAPIYGFLLYFVYEPVFMLISQYNVAFRFLVWSVSFTAIEALSGFLYKQLLGFCPWDYSQSRWKMFKNGYTKWSLIPLWGFAGIGIEFISAFVVALSPNAVKVARELLPANMVPFIIGLFICGAVVATLVVIVYRKIMKRVS